MHAFQLWREFKLSLAEIYTLFPTTEIVYADMGVCILNTQNSQEIIEKAQKMGWVIKIIALFENYAWKPAQTILEQSEGFEGKFRYGISALWGDEKNLKRILMDTKKLLKEGWMSARFVNKNFSNLSSAQIIGEGLVKRSSDFSIISAGGMEYFGKTIWVQDIEKYSQRDYGKTRDMVVGMLPPKLAQMMINISYDGQVKIQSIYDPFCGLWTILIESILMGNKQVYGSDISPENIEKTKKNITFARKEFDNVLKTSETSVLDAKGISSSPYLKKSDVIVTEGYLGQAFLKHTVSEQKIQEEKKHLLDIYEKFFFGLHKANFKGIIVISFPFWEIKGKYFYFSEVYDIIKKYCKNLPLLPKDIEFQHTKSGSLLYKRKDQVVGREIFKLKIRK